MPSCWRRSGRTTRGGKYVALRCCPRGSVARHGAAALQQLADCLLIAAVLHCVVGIWALSCHELEEDGHEVFDLAHVRGMVLDPHVLPLTGVLLVAGPLVMLYFLGLFDVVRDTVEHAGVALFARHEGWLAEQFSIKRFEANPRFEDVAEGLERYTAAERFHVKHARSTSDASPRPRARSPSAASTTTRLPLMSRRDESSLPAASAATVVAAADTAAVFALGAARGRSSADAPALSHRDGHF